MNSAKVDELAKKIWEFNLANDPIKKSDAIWILCSNDIRVADRAAELFHLHFAPLVIVSGGEGILSRGLFPHSEAEAFAERVIQLGVSDEKVILETKSTNTGENVQFTKQLLSDNNLYLTSFIVVQKPYMLKRSYATIKKRWPEITITLTSPQIPYEEYPNEIITKEAMINTLVGDLQRIKLYPEKGFQIPLEIPDEVWDAYQELIQLGYTKHLI